MNAILFIGALMGMIGVGLGAFGAHGLAKRVSEQHLKTYQTGIQYHLIHALAMVFAGLYALAAGGSVLAVWAGILFLAGIVLFSGSLYGLAMERIGGRLGVITPIGGLMFVVGWALFAVAMLQRL